MKHPIIELFEKTVREHEMIGTFDVSDRPIIEAEYQETKRKLEELITNAINCQILPDRVFVDGDGKLRVNR